MKKAFFITGTDTEIGKTYCTVALLKYFNQQNKKTAALKPIASDAEQTPDGLRNSDALQLQAAMSMQFSYDQINPFTYELPTAPHLLADPNTLSVSNVLERCQPILKSDYDVLLIEGAGGWAVPLNEKESFSDLAAAFGFPIILTVGMKLGCINHSILTLESIRARKLTFAGWIANHINPNMLKQTEYIETLTAQLGRPPLGTISYNGEFQPDPNSIL